MEGRSASRYDLFRLWAQAILAIACLVLLTIEAELSLPQALGVISAWLIFSSSVILWWAGTWAERSGRRTWQFGVRSLVLLVVMVSCYLATVRWLAIELLFDGKESDLDEWGFLAAAICPVYFLPLGVPLQAFLLESLMRGAAWLVRRRSAQRWIGAMRHRTQHGSTRPEAPSEGR